MWHTDSHVVYEFQIMKNLPSEFLADKPGPGRGAWRASAKLHTRQVTQAAVSRVPRPVFKLRPSKNEPHVGMTCVLPHLPHSSSCATRQGQTIRLAASSFTNSSRRLTHRVISARRDS